MTNKKGIIIVSLVLTIMFVASTVGAASAQERTPGVAKGDVFTYNYSVTWNSTDPMVPMPDAIADIAKVQSFQIEITDVESSKVNAKVTTTYTDGTTSTQVGYVDVQSGDINLLHGNLIIASNLDVDERIYPSGGDATITNSDMRTYQSGDRVTNQLLVETTLAKHYDKTDVYFDKAKGIAVSSYYVSRDTFGSATEIFTETITNTNPQVWALTVPEFPVFALPLLVLIVVPVVLVALKKKWIGRQTDDVLGGVEF
ncbi:MAG: hypothetical protein ACQCN6_08255 [Candidatus Bathyarchaeia archaeon]|jgi:hypothetical protein